MCTLKEKLTSTGKPVEMVERNAAAIYKNAEKERVFCLVNLSSIESFLVKQAAKHCNHYASDIVIDINAMNSKLRNITEGVLNGTIEAPATETVFFGFRDMGVDGTDFVTIKFADPKTYGALTECYKALYYAEITVDKPRGCYPVLADTTVYFCGVDFTEEGGEGNA